MTYQARFGDGSEVVLPATLEQELGLEPGDSLVVEQDGFTITIKPYSQVVREVQAQVRAMTKAGEGSAVDELLAERRAEAEREHAETREWLRSHGHE